MDAKVDAGKEAANELINEWKRFIYVEFFQEHTFQKRINLFISLLSYKFVSFKFNKRYDMVLVLRGFDLLSLFSLGLA